jgi:flagellar P-ring protein precursor FlgI
VVVPRTDAEIVEEDGHAARRGRQPGDAGRSGARLNALGVSPRDMIDILKAIKAAGALHAEFVVQ